MIAKTRIWVLATAVICIALMLGGVVLGLLPQVTNAASTSSLAGDLEANTETQRVQLASLKSAKDRVELSDELEELRAAIPDTAASADFIELLDHLEEESGATLNEFVVSTPQAGDAASQAPASDSGAAASSTATGSGPPTVGGATMIPIELDLAGSGDQTLEFVRGLQSAERLVIVNLVVQAGEASTKVNGAIYVWGEGVKK